MTLAHDIGDSVKLRPYTADDAEVLYRALDADRDAIGKFMLWVYDVDSVEKARSTIEAWVKQNEEHRTLALAIEHEGELLGSAFHCNANRLHGHVEIGYWLTTQARGKGIATRAVKTLLDLTFGELGFHRALLRIAPDNHASVAIAERLGLECEGRMRDLWKLRDGTRRDGLFYATTADRWPPKPKPSPDVAPYEPKQITLRDGRTLTLREPVPDEADALLRYLDAVRRESDGILFSAEDELPNLAAEREWIQARRDAPNAITLGAWHDDQLIALGGIDASGRAMRTRHTAILGLSVRKAWWRAGIGRALSNELIAFARSHPRIDVLELGAWAFNAKAIALYESLGFTHAGRQPHHGLFEDDTYADHLLMSMWVGQQPPPPVRTPETTAAEPAP
ncbi:MAG: GNAT family N-acetyltransferase [Planctomycetota bacterium]